MDSEKRVVLAFALSFAILVLWRTLLVKEPPPPPPKTPSGQVKTLPGQSREVAPLPPVPLRVQQGTKAEEIVVEGNSYRVTLSSEGAVVKSWVLKKYQDEKGQPLDVINRVACEALGYPMSFSLADSQLSKKLNTALFVATPSGSTLTAPTKVAFVYSDGKIQAQKEFSFGAGYEIRGEVSLSEGQRYLPVEVAWSGGFGDHSLPDRVKDAANQVVFGTAEKLKTEAQSDIEGAQSISGPLQIAGLMDRYFVSILFPGSPDQVFRFGRQSWTPPDWKGEEKNKPKALAAMLGTPQARPLSFRLFVAPKDLDVLRSTKPPLERLVDYGWFSFVAKPLFLALRYIYNNWLHNYGWAIVILTILINLAMFPLKLKQVRSAQEMQRIAPLVKSIQAKYKDYKFNDPRKQRMNQEIMKLYQEHHINPLGGCLPVVLQLPFLYGFYKVLDLSIELRHAPWFAWIKDLSAPDRLYILPTLMIVTMFIQQKLTPIATADPAQQRMMTIMPILFGIMFYSFASGLVLYWLTGSVVGIAQQVLIDRLMPVQQPIPAQRKAVGVKQ